MNFIDKSKVIYNAFYYRIIERNPDLDATNTNKFHIT